MPLLMAAMSALLFGVADFYGGLISRRLWVLAVVVWSQAAGLVLVVAAAGILGRGSVTVADLGWGAAAGVVGAGGLTAFYRGLATGRVSVVAPVAAMVGAVVPVGAGLAFGERPSSLAAVGLLLALVAIALVPGGAAAPGWSRAGMGTMLGVVAGALFGLFFVFLSRTESSAGLWPLVAARAASVLGAVVVGLGIRGRSLRMEGGRLRQVAAVGLADMGANIFFLLAVRSDLLVLVAAISSLYPAVTVVLARVLLDDRIRRWQAVGLTLAAGGVVMIAIG